MYKLSQIDYKYGKKIKFICQKSLNKFIGLPLEAEDLYFEFLYLCATKLLNEYNESFQIPLKNYLFKKCQYFCMNKCRHFTNNKNKIMNFSSSLTYEEIYHFEEMEHKINLDCLNLIEKEIYNYLVYQKFNLKKIAQKLALQQKIVKKILLNIQKKLGKILNFSK